MGTGTVRWLLYQNMVGVLADRNLYSEWFRIRIPFMGWKVLIQIVIQPGDANGDSYGPGAVVTGFPIQGNYKSQTWHGKPNTSIVLWWINVGYYKPGQ